MRNHDHRFSRGDRNFIIFTEASGVVGPGESTFHHPAPRKFLPLVQLDSLWNINLKDKLFLDIRDKSPSISGVCAECLDRRILLISSLCDKYPAFCIVNIGGMNDNRQQTTQHIHYDVPLSAFRFFLHQSHVLRWLLPFLHFGNQWSRSLDPPYVRHLFASFLQDASIFYPTARWF